MKLLYSIILGFLYGFTELTPVSGQAHKQVLQYIFGMDTGTPLLDVLVHTAVAAAVIVSNYPTISRLRRDSRLYNRRRKGVNMRGIYELRILKTAAALLILGHLVYAFTVKSQPGLVQLSITGLLLSVVLLVTDHMRHANKDARHASVFDSVLLGVSSALSVFPGLSRIGMALSFATARGIDVSLAYLWTLLLSIPALIVIILLDIFAVVTVGIGVLSFAVFIQYLLAAIFAFVGALCAVTFVKYLLIRSGFSGFGYYNIGFAVFTFVLYLIA